MNENGLMLVRQFEGKTVHTFVWNGRPCWVAGEIAEAIGYEDPSATVRHCIEAEEFEPGFEYEVLKGGDLNRFKEMANFVIEFNPITNKTRNLTIFYEEGLYGFLAYTDKPEGKRFRKWIRSEVVPEIRRTGSYQLPGKMDPGKLARAEVEMQKVKAAQAKLLLEAARDFQNVLSGESVQLLVGKAAEIICGTPVLPLPPVEKDYSAEEIGRLAGLSGNMIGRLANAHNIKTEEYGRYVLDKSRHSAKQVVAFRYNERGKDKLLELAAKLKAENERRASKRKAAGEKQEEAAR